MVLPIHPIPPEFDPVGTEPAVACKAHDFLDKIPVPHLFAVGFHCIDPGTERGKVNALFAYGGRRKNWFTAVNFVNHFSGRGFQDGVVTGGGPHVEKVAGDGRSGDVVAVSFAAFGCVFPDHLVRFGIDREDDSRSIDHEDTTIGDDRRSKNRIRRWHGSKQPDISRKLFARSIARSLRAALKLVPLSRGRRCEQQKNRAEQETFHPSFITFRQTSEKPFLGRGSVMGRWDRIFEKFHFSAYPPT